MAFDLTTIDPSEIMAFRDQWIKESGLESVGADRIFENCGLSELVELDTDELKEYSKEIGLSVIERKRLIKGVNKLNGIETPRTPRTPRTPITPQIIKQEEEEKPEKQQEKEEEPQQQNKPLSPKTASLQISTSTSSGSSNKKPKTKRKRAKSNAGKDNQDSKKLSAKRDKMKRKRSKSRGKKSPTPSRTPSRNRSRAGTGTRSPSTSDAPMYDPTNKTSTEEVPIISSPRVRDDEIDEEKDMLTQINEAIEKITMDASATKTEIRKTFMEFKQKITDREIKLLHDVDTTLDKKRRLLETQLEYVKDNSFGTKELACNPNMSLLIEKPEIMRTLITAGWVQGATSDNKEEQEMQDRERKRRELSIQQYLTVERLKQVTIHERECKSKREDSLRLTDEIQQEIEQINIRTAKCEKELAQAKPLLEEAKKLVSTISKKQLDEIRVLKKPPAVVELVMSAVAVMLGNKIKSWRDIQKVISNSKFVPSILNFDTMSLKKKTREEVVKYVKHEDFNEERANKASKVAGPLVKWVKSQVKYSELLDIVRPMQKEIKVLRKKLDKKQKQSKMCRQVINDLELKISKARSEITEMVDNMIELQDKYNFGDDYVYKQSELYKTISL